MSHILRAVLAASMLAGIASAHAGEASNGLHLNGITLNRLAFNGLSQNRLAFNGTKAEAPSQLSGISLDRVVLR